MTVQTINITPELKEKIDKTARDLNITQSAVFKIALSKYFKSEGQ